MLYTREDFLRLEMLTYEELKLEIKKATQSYDEAQEYFNSVEEEEASNGVMESARISVGLLISQLNNIEGYITKARGLYDSALGEIVLTKQTLKNRVKVRKALPKLSLK